jgi:hypothetical protein
VTYLIFTESTLPSRMVKVVVPLCALSDAVTRTVSKTPESLRTATRVPRFELVMAGLPRKSVPVIVSVSVFPITAVPLTCVAVNTDIGRGFATKVNVTAADVTARYVAEASWLAVTIQVPIAVAVSVVRESHNPSQCHQSPHTSWD